MIGELSVESALLCFHIEQPGAYNGIFSFSSLPLFSSIILVTSRLTFLSYGHERRRSDDMSGG